ncbi:MAG: UDP-N-acetylmuramoyl-tripeptide--D-alanyl-D-alanine ligase [Saprospiraceae bacterium]|nr:UDP-N-acetylmuramoyl-tripeptide--D-alanyl-D-alanine ligase [Saprospiraceae bacterium]
MFFALRGENTDGNKYASSAIQNEARYAVIDDPKFQEDERFLLVPDVLKTLQNLASFHRNQFSIPVIGITGSNGKTTTKELMHAVLSAAYRCHYTKGNYNNHIGVPLTLLAMKEDIEVAVIEMGANHPGEIAQLCEICRPTHGLITNVGKAHLEGFGSFEGVKKTKAELYDFLNGNSGLAFINRDEPYLWDLAADLRGRRISYGSKEKGEEENWLRGDCSQAPSGFLEIKFWDELENEAVAKSLLTGTYNCPNLISAISIGLYFKVPSGKIVEGLANYLPSDNRSQILEKDGVTYIMDAYNANPTSIRAALESLDERKETHKFAILGAMKELGEYAEQEHLEVLRYASSIGLEKIFAVGEEYRIPAEELDIQWFHNIDSLKQLEVSFPKGAVVLLKGSRSEKLESLLS